MLDVLADITLRIGNVTEGVDDLLTALDYMNVNPVYRQVSQVYVTFVDGMCYMHVESSAHVKQKHGSCGMYITVALLSSGLSSGLCMPSIGMYAMECGKS